MSFANDQNTQDEMHTHQGIFTFTDECTGHFVASVCTLSILKHMIVFS